MHPHYIEQSDWTVADLIRALRVMPQDADVRVYLDVTLEIDTEPSEILAVCTDSFSDDVSLVLR